MINRCNAVGVDIYADVVMNNWANHQASNIGSGGSYWTPYNYPDLGPNDFHAPCHLGRSTDYSNANEVWYCGLYDMPDLAIGRDYAKNYAADYLKRLVDMGVKGFRIDAAKHMNPVEIKGVLEAAGNPWSFLEVIGAAGEAAAIQPNQYSWISQVTEFGYGTAVKGNFDGQIKNLRTLGEGWGLLPSESATVFIVNHDRERGHGGGNMYTYKDGAKYNLANVFMLAFPYGYPKIMSGYQFTDTEAGPPSQGPNNCTNAAWNCDHRWDNIANMVGFRNFTQNAWSVNNWWDNGSNAIGFSRGDLGYILINNETYPVTVTVQTGMPAGQYCNILAGKDECSGATITVNTDGTAQFSVASMSAAAIHGGAMACVSDCPEVRNLPSLQVRGTFNEWTNTAMTYEDGNWSAVVTLDGAANQRFKFDVYGDWTVNYGDIDFDGTLDLAGADITYAGVGVYLLEVDDQTLTYRITPLFSNQAPVAVVTPNAATLSVGESLTLDAASSSDVDGNIVAYSWSTGETTPTITVNYTQVGTYSVSVTVFDDLQASDTTSTTISVTSSDEFLSNLPSLNLRGTMNAWGAMPMTLVADHTWQTTVNLIGGSNQRFKFDTYSDWTYNYGDNNNDGIADLMGGDIFTSASGEYAITFNDATLQYTIRKNDGTLVSTYSSMNFRGTPNAWTATPMSLVADYTWQTLVNFNGQSQQRFKFDVAGDWSTNYGDSNQDSVAEINGSDIFTHVNGTYLVEFNDLTKQFRVVAQ